MVPPDQSVTGPRLLDLRDETIVVDAGAGRQKWYRHPILRRNEVAVSSGTILGVWARFAISDYGSRHFTTTFPVATLAINLLGCLLIGVVQSLLLDLFAIRREVQLFLAVGLLGGFTTFSTFGLEVILLLDGDHLVSAALYMALSLVGGLGAAGLGIGLAHRGYQVVSHCGKLQP